eukprot:gene4530-7907_t
MDAKIMLGANYENSSILKEISSQVGLIKTLKRKLPYRIYNFEEKLPYYCQDVTMVESDKINLHKFWESPRILYPPRKWDKKNFKIKENTNTGHD